MCIKNRPTKSLCSNHTKYIKDEQVPAIQSESVSPAIKPKLMYTMRIEKLKSMLIRTA